MAAPPQMPPGAQVVTFRKNAAGEFVDQSGLRIDPEVLRQSNYRPNAKGELVDSRGQLVLEVKAVVQPASEVDSEELDEPASEDLFDQTQLCGEDAAEGIAVNRALQQMIRQFGAAAVSTENIWLYFLELVQQESFSKGFEVLLRFGDDFYFLRACVMLGGQVLKKLHRRVGQRVLRRLCQIKLAGNLDSTALHFIERGVRHNFLDQVDLETAANTAGALTAISAHFNHAVRDRAIYLADLVAKLLEFN